MNVEIAYRLDTLVAVSRVRGFLFVYRFCVSDDLLRRVMVVDIWWVLGF